MMRWIYLSPHFDDVVLSCGGVIYEQVQAGQAVEIWTMCAGAPPNGSLPPFAAELHARWQTGAEAVSARRAEDIAACRVLGAAWRHWDLPDCIYRRLPDGEPLIRGEDDLWVDGLDERALPDLLTARTWLADQLPVHCRLVVPLTIGRHIDHHIARAAAESLGRPLWYYADYPYVVTKRVNVRAWLGPGWRRQRRLVSPAGLAAWQTSIAQYHSQISTFWADLGQMQTAVQEYLAQGGNALWKRQSATGMG